MLKGTRWSLGEGVCGIKSSEVKGLDNGWELRGVKCWEEKQGVVKDQGGNSRPSRLFCFHILGLCFTQMDFYTKQTTKKRVIYSWICSYPMSNWTHNLCKNANYKLQPSLPYPSFLGKVFFLFFFSWQSNVVAYPEMEWAVGNTANHNIVGEGF